MTLNDTDYPTLLSFAESQLQSVREPDMTYMERAGLWYPDRTPAIWDKLPSDWDHIMETQGIGNLHNHELEKYLEEWDRLLGHAYWIQGIYTARLQVLQRATDYVRDFIFVRASGGREQKAATAGSHEITRMLLDSLTDTERKLTEINGLVRKWEKIDFSISRAITVRSNR